MTKAKAKIEKRGPGAPPKAHGSKIQRGEDLTNNQVEALKEIADELNMTLAATKRMAVQWFIDARASAKVLQNANERLEQVEEVAGTNN